MTSTALHKPVAPSFWPLPHLTSASVHSQALCSLKPDDPGFPGHCLSHILCRQMEGKGQRCRPTWPEPPELPPPTTHAHFDQWEQHLLLPAGPSEACGVTPDPAACGMFPGTGSFPPSQSVSVSVGKVLTADTRCLPSARPREPSTWGAVCREARSVGHAPSPISEDLGWGTAPWKPWMRPQLNSPQADRPITASTSRLTHQFLC